MMWAKIKKIMGNVIFLITFFSAVTGTVVWRAVVGRVDYNREVRRSPERIDSINVRIDSICAEIAIWNRVTESIHYDVVSHDKFQAMLVLLLREMNRDHDDKEYYTVFIDGEVIVVDLRDTEYGHIWAFLSDNTMFPTYPSPADNKSAIIPNDGRESVLIREKEH